MLETRVQPTYSLDIYIIFTSLFTADVFVTYVRDKGSTNLFPGHLYNIDLSLYSDIGHKHISCKERDKYNIDVQGIGWLNPCL
jgi:hypothetical protein